MKQISRVLAAVDFSVSARSADEHALALARHHAAELVVIQAVPPEHPFNWHGRERRELAASLRQMASKAKVEFAYRVQHGDPAEIVLLHASSVRPDVIVVGSAAATERDRRLPPRRGRGRAAWVFFRHDHRARVGGNAATLTVQPDFSATDRIAPHWNGYSSSWSSGPGPADCAGREVEVLETYALLGFATSTRAPSAVYGQGPRTDRGL